MGSDESLWTMEPLMLCKYCLTFSGTTDRQRRLCACYLAREIVWDLIADEQLKEVIKASEAFADGEIPRREYFALTRATRAAFKPLRDKWRHGSWNELTAEEVQLYFLVSAVDITTAPKFSPTNLRVAASRIWRTICSWLDWTKKTESERAMLTLAVKEKFATLPDEIFGKPEPANLLSRRTETITQLAQSLYVGEDCRFALHDALLEQGEETLASHFSEGSHPKGCWALDLILERNAA